MFFLFVAAALAAEQPVIQCREVPASRSYWAWREVDGRKCWFEGRHTVPKTQLYWSRSNERRSSVVPPDPVNPSPGRSDDPVLPMSDKKLPAWEDPTFWNDPTPFNERRYW